MPWPLRPCALITSGALVRQQTSTQSRTRGSSAASHQAFVAPIDMPIVPRRCGSTSGRLVRLVERADLVEHHHPVEYLAVPEHQLEGVFLSDVPVLVAFALAETPAVDRERHQAAFHATRRAGRAR